jgi:hypothetical protein
VPALSDTGLAALLENDPARAYQLLAKLKSNVVTPHEGGQREVVEHPALYKVLNCGRRWGKTKIGVKCLVKEALKGAEKGKKSRLVWWVAPTYRVVKRGYAETLRQLPRELLEHDPPPETNFDAGRSVTLRLKNGNRIEFYSAERPGGMLGEGVDYVVLDEAATIPSTVWEQVIRPTLLDTNGGGMLISTPRGKNWFHKRWQAGQREDDSEWMSWTFTTYDNPHIKDEQIEAMRDELPALIFSQEVLAKFVADGSSVFMWTDKQVEKCDELKNGLVIREGKSPVKGHVFLGIDLAKTTDFTVLYGANETNGHNVFYDRFQNLRWSEQKRRIRRAVALLEAQGSDGVTLVIDATGVGDPIVEDLEDGGFDVIGLNFTTYKDKMVRRLAKDLETGRCYLLDRDLQEFEDYQMSATKSNKISYSAPDGAHDDVVSAKMLQHWGSTTEGSPNIMTISGALTPDAQPEPAEDTLVSADEELDSDGNDWSDLIDADDLAPSDPRTPNTASAPNAPSIERRTPEELLRDPGVWA